jgi:hypothetical protein
MAERGHAGGDVQHGGDGVVHRDELLALVGERRVRPRSRLARINRLKKSSGLQAPVR